MNSTAVIPPFSASPARLTRVPRARTAFLIVIAACLAAILLNVFWRESYTGDEGFYGVTARNMLNGAGYWTQPSYFPLGSFAEDKGGFAHPPFNSYFYAVGLWLARDSLTGPELVSLAGFALLLFAVYRMLGRHDELAARVAIVLLAASPAMTGYFWMLEAEPLMTAFGMLGLYCALQAGPLVRHTGWVFAAGLCLGMSFALKLWLFGPLALAIVMALALQVRVVPPARARLSGAGAKIPVGKPRAWPLGIARRRTARAIAPSEPGGASVLPAVLRAAAAFLVGCCLPSAVHLAAVALSHPEDLSFWFNDVYFGVFTQSGISGSKLDGSSIASNWVHPIWYYGAALYRDHFFLLPAFVFGAASAWRELRRRPQLPTVFLVGAAGVAPLSLLKVKEPLYVLPCAVFLYLLAAICVAAAVRRLRHHGDLDRGSWWMGLLATGGLLLAVPAAYLRGIKPEDLTLGFVIAHSAALAVFAMGLLWSVRTRQPAALVRCLFASAMVAIVFNAGWRLVEQRPRDETIVRMLARTLAENAPGELSLIASNFKSYQYYAFAKGRYWHDIDRSLEPAALLADPEYAKVRAFILSPEDQQKPENAVWLHWLENNATERTAELTRRFGRETGWRVFERDGLR